MSTKEKYNTKRRNAYFAKPLQNFIEPLLRPVFKDKSSAASKIIKEWNYIIGKELSAHCLPGKITFPKGKNSEGTLTIICESGFALTLQHMQPIIIEQIATYFGYRAVSRIIIEQSLFPSSNLPLQPSLSSNFQEKDSKKKKEKINNSLEYMASLEKNEIKDDELKKALYELAKTISSSNLAEVKITRSE